MVEDTIQYIVGGDGPVIFVILLGWGSETAPGCWDQIDDHE